MAETTSLAQFVPPGKFTIERVKEVADRAASVLGVAREELLAPDSRKTAPTFSVAQLAALCDVERSHINYRLTKGDLPNGTMAPGSSRRTFSVVEVRKWTREYRAARMRPEKQRCVVLAVANFKGGVSKTTTTMCLAQGLALRGHRVLAIDADPQASLTTLFGLLPEFDIPVERTLEPLFSGDKPDVLEAIDATYWNGLDLIAAGIGLYGAEFSLVAGSAGRDFWNALSRGLVPVLDDYDIILIDTPPSLSNITINALWAADGVLVPVPPSALDFASSVQFWKLLVEVGESLDPRGPPKEFEFFHILASRVDANDPSTASVRSWLQLAYAGMVLPVEVPRTIVTSNASVEFATVYDVETYAGAAKTYRRAVDAYDELVRHVEDSIVATWSARATRRA